VNIVNPVSWRTISVEAADASIDFGALSDQRRLWLLSGLPKLKLHKTLKIHRDDEGEFMKTSHHPKTLW
jgi:hypothetical protein